MTQHLSNAELDPPLDTINPIQPVATTVPPATTDPIAAPTGTDPLADPNQVPPTAPATTDTVDATGTTVEDLYPGGGTGTGGAGDIGDVIGSDSGTVADPTIADVTETDPGVTDIDTTGAAGGTDRITDILDTGGGGVDASQTTLTDEQRVDEELARILGQDSPLLAQARAEAARYANTRGLQNTSMAAGMATDAMVRAALPMAQQNAQQGFQREMANTELRQQAGIFTAEQQNRLTALEAELGQSLNIFNADQLNQAEQIMGQLRTALEQQDAAAYNAASQQLVDLQRDAEAQQSELDYRSSQAEADAVNQRNSQIIDSVSRLNQQYLQNQGNADIATIQGTYQQLISTNQAAGSIFNSTLSAMAALMDNPDMTPQQVATGLASMQSMLEASLRMLSNINDMDFGADVNATIPGGAAGGGGGGGTSGDTGLPAGGAGGGAIP